MAKALIAERQLLDAINIALKHDWRPRDGTCEVHALKKVARPDRNWEVDISGTSGSRLSVPECDELLARVLDELTPKYDVLWDN